MSERVSEADRTKPFHSISGGRTSVLSIRFEADWTPNGVKKRPKRMLVIEAKDALSLSTFGLGLFCSVFLKPS